MARYEHLPIYKSAMDLALEMEKTVRNMSLYDKYSIGTELRKRSLAILSFVVRENSTDNKKEVLKEIRITIEEVKQLLFLGKETKALTSFTIFKKLVEQAEAVAKQKEGWKTLQAKVNSYLGRTCHSNSNSLKKHIQKLLKPYSPFIDFHKGYIRLKPNMYYKYHRFNHQISFYKKEFLEHTLIIKKGRFYEIIGKDVEELASLNRLKPYYKKGKNHYGFRRHRLRKILYSMKANFMLGV